MTTGEMGPFDAHDSTARRMVSDLQAVVEADGKATRAAVEELFTYIKAHEKDQRAVLDGMKLALEEIDSATARLSAAQKRTERHLAENDRRDAEIATSVARIATTGGATGGVAGAVIMALLSALHGCSEADPAPVGGGQHGAPSAYVAGAQP